MNTKQRTAMIFVLLLSLVISSCAPGQLFGPTATPTMTSTPTMTATPMATATPIPTNTPVLPPISGTLQGKGDTDPIANRRIVLCLKTDTSSLDCTLTTLLTTSDTNGYYKFTDVPAGQYLVFYNSGWSDFDAGLAKWTSKTIKVGDVQWLMDNLFEVNADGKYSFMLPAGAIINARVSAYRFFFKSPFFWAHDCGSNGCSDENDIIPVEFDVTPGGHIQKNFTVYYHSGN